MRSTAEVVHILELEHHTLFSSVNSLCTNGIFRLS
jgi:hypothetical protein